MGKKKKELEPSRTISATNNSDGELVKKKKKKGKKENPSDGETDDRSALPIDGSSGIGHSSRGPLDGGAGSPGPSPLDKSDVKKKKKKSSKDAREEEELIDVDFAALGREYGGAENFPQTAAFGAVSDIFPSKTESSGLANPGSSEGTESRIPVEDDLYCDVLQNSDRSGKFSPLVNRQISSNSSSENQASQAILPNTQEALLTGRGLASKLAPKQTKNGDDLLDFIQGRPLTQNNAKATNRMYGGEHQSTTVDEQGYAGLLRNVSSDRGHIIGEFQTGQFQTGQFQTGQVTGNYTIQRGAQNVPEVSPRNYGPNLSPTQQSRMTATHSGGDLSRVNESGGNGIRTGSTNLSGGIRTQSGNIMNSNMMNSNHHNVYMMNSNHHNYNHMMNLMQNNNKNSFQNGMNSVMNSVQHSMNSVPHGQTNPNMSMLRGMSTAGNMDNIPHHSIANPGTLRNPICRQGNLNPYNPNLQKNAQQAQQKNTQQAQQKNTQQKIHQSHRAQNGQSVHNAEENRGGQQNYGTLSGAAKGKAQQHMQGVQGPGYAPDMNAQFLALQQQKGIQRSSNKSPRSTNDSTKTNKRQDVSKEGQFIDQRDRHVARLLIIISLVLMTGILIGCIRGLPIGPSLDGARSSDPEERKEAAKNLLAYARGKAGFFYIPWFMPSMFHNDIVFYNDGKKNHPDDILQYIPEILFWNYVMLILLVVVWLPGIILHAVSILGKHRRVIIRPLRGVDRNTTRSSPVRDDPTSRDRRDINNSPRSQRGDSRDRGGGYQGCDDDSRGNAFEMRNHASKQTTGTSNYNIMPEDSADHYNQRGTTSDEDEITLAEKLMTSLKVLDGTDLEDRNNSALLNRKSEDNNLKHPLISDTENDDQLISDTETEDQESEEVVFSNSYYDVDNINRGPKNLINHRVNPIVNLVDNRGMATIEGSKAKSTRRRDCCASCKSCFKLTFCERCCKPRNPKRKCCTFSSKTLYELADYGWYFNMSGRILFPIFAFIVWINMCCRSSYAVGHMIETGVSFDRSDYVVSNIIVREIVIDLFLKIIFPILLGFLVARAKYFIQNHWIKTNRKEHDKEAIVFITK